MLNELDKELEARGLRFTRYADDCVIAVRSESSAKRVMRTITDWIQRKLGLKVNMTKTHITRPAKLKYLGFGFWKDYKANEWKCRPHEDSVARFKKRLKELTCRKMPGKVTLVNLMNGSDRLRLSVICEESVEDRSGYEGNPLALHFDGDVRSLPDVLAQCGAGHHWTGMTGDYLAEWKLFARMCGIEFTHIKPEH